MQIPCPSFSFLFTMTTAHPELPLRRLMPTIHHGHAIARMMAYGFTFGESERVSYVNFYNYTMPPGWRCIDQSYPGGGVDWMIVDPDNFVRFEITGSWGKCLDGIVDPDWLEVGWIGTDSLGNPTPFVPRNLTCN